MVHVKRYADLAPRPMVGITSRVYFRGGPGGTFAPPMKDFSPPQELVELAY